MKFKIISSEYSCVMCVCVFSKATHEKGDCILNGPVGSSKQTK